MRNSPEYVFQFLEFFVNGSKGYYFDTLGVLIPSDTLFISKITAKYPNIHFDFHAHNDYDLLM
jgi:D-citramalate synthase